MTQYIVPSDKYLDDCLNSYRLATLIGCLSPDSLDSPGGLFLSRFRYAFANEFWSTRGGRGSGLLSPPSPKMISEVCDNAPSASTHDMWKEYVDLGVYHNLVDIKIGSLNIDEDSFDDDTTVALDLGDLARKALVEIANRLADALLSEWEADDDEPDDGDDE